MSLFLKVYLTIVGSLAAVAGTLALAAFFGPIGDADGWGNQREHILAAMFPAGDDPEQLDLTIERLHRGIDADIAVFGPDGAVLAEAGNPISSDVLQERRFGRAERGRVLLFDLPGERLLAARIDPVFQHPRSRFLLVLGLIATAIGIAAWPIVRHLTRRLEELRRGVEAWGGGQLVTRVPVHGNDEVAAVARSFNQAAEEIERLVNSHRSLLANASHELRSPLARLRMAIDLLPADAPDARRAEIVRSLGELDVLVEEILLASRLDHVDGLEAAEPVDLLALAAEEAAHHGLAAGGRPVAVSGDRRLLARMVRNLIHNALRHGAPPIEIEVSRAEDRAVLSVCDHGPGVPDDERDRVFEAFYRPSGRSESAGGWGLGLSLVRQIASHHKGRVFCEAAPTGGARFVVELPVAGDTT